MIDGKQRGYPFPQLRRDPVTGIEPKDDRYIQDGRKKALGYPQGQATMFLAGRLLQNADFGGARGFITAAAAATTDTTNNFHTTANERAMYLYWVEHGACFDYTEDVIATWQIWADNKFVASGVSAPHVSPIGVYIPPNSNCSFYSRVVSALGAPNNRYFPYAITWVEFDAEMDVWEFGSGSLALNPAIAALAWP